jgi:hypothetical protein
MGIMAPAICNMRVQCGDEQREGRRMNTPHPGRIMRQKEPKKQGGTERSQNVGHNTSSQPSMPRRSMRKVVKSPSQAGG